MADFHIDGFRLDATHTIFDDSKKHILQELGELVHEHGRYIIAEDERTEPRLITPIPDSGFGLDAVWADDFHHAAEVAMMEDSIYRGRFKGELDELLDALCQGWTSRSFREAAAKASGVPSRRPLSRAVRLLHFESRPGWQPGLWRAHQSFRLPGNLPRGQRPPLPHSLHASALHGPGVGRVHAFPILH